MHQLFPQLEPEHVAPGHPGEVQRAVHGVGAVDVDLGASEPVVRLRESGSIGVPGDVDGVLPVLVQPGGEARARGDVVIALVGTLLPFMIYPIYLSLSSHSENLRSAAASLGASPTAVFTSITLPLSIDGVTAGSIFVFVTAAGFFVTPALLGGGRVLTAATFIDQQIQEFLDWPLAAAAASTLLVLVAVGAVFLPRSRSVARSTG